MPSKESGRRFSDFGPSLSSVPPSAFAQSVAVAKSVSVADLLAAGKLVEPPDVSSVTLVLQSFDVTNKTWSTATTLDVVLEKKNFAEGGFRDAFIATPTKSGMPSKWVLKKAKDKSINNIIQTRHLSSVHYTYKQVQKMLLPEHWH